MAPGTLVGEAGEQGCHPRHVAVVLARLVGCAEVYVGDPLGVDAGAFDHGPDRVRGEVVGADPGEGAAVGAHRSAQRLDHVSVGHREEPYPYLVLYILGTLAVLAFMIGVLVLVGHFYPGSGAELLDWQPTRSPELEVQNEIDDVRQMMEAQNEMRRRRGVPEMTEAELQRKVAEDERLRLRGRGPFDPLSAGPPIAAARSLRCLARALIIGCGCRGRELGERLLAAGWAVRGTSRREDGLAAIEAAGVEAAIADPDRVGTVLELVGDVAVVFHLLGSAAGQPEALAEIHGPRLERLRKRSSTRRCAASYTRRSGASTPAC